MDLSHRAPWGLLSRRLYLTVLAKWQMERQGGWWLKDCEAQSRKENRKWSLVVEIYNHKADLCISIPKVYFTFMAHFLSLQLKVGKLLMCRGINNENERFDTQTIGRPNAENFIIHLKEKYKCLPFSLFKHEPFAEQTAYRTTVTQIKGAFVPHNFFWKSDKTPDETCF